MRAYALSRLAQTVLVVFLSLTAVFMMVRLSGDPVLLFMPMDIQAKDVNEFRQRLGFNDPVPVQYARFVAGAVRGDFGESLRYRRDALGLVLERLPATFLLAATSLLLTMCVAVPLGVLSAVHRNTPLDHAGTVVTVLGQATPGFWLGLMLIYVFSVRLRWLPTGGTGGLAHLVMPSIVLAAFFSARIARLTRSAVLDVLGAEYILTARAKGLRETRVIGKHTLRNSAIPIVTLAGLEAGRGRRGAGVARAQRPARARFRREPQPAGLARPPPRHRSARPGPPGARPPWRAARALHRRLHRGDHRRRRRSDRPRRGVRRAVARRSAHASGRRPALVPVHPARHDHQRHRGPRAPEHHPQPFGRRMGRVCSRRARRGAVRQAARFRAGGIGARDEPPPPPVPARPAERRALHHRRREPPVLVLHRRGGRDKFSRVRGAASDPRLGQHAV